MRILQVIESFGAGSMQVVLTISERLAAGGHQLAIAHGRVAESPADPRSVIAAEVELYALRWRRTPMSQVSVARDLRRLARTWQPDVVHLHSSFAGIVGAAALPELVPLVYTPHGYSFTRRTGRAYASPIFRMLERIVAHRVDLVGAVSETEARLARDLGAPRVAVIPNGIPELDHPPAATHSRNDPPTVVAVGRIDPARQPASVARILASLADVACSEWVGGGDSADGGVTALRAAGVPITGWLDRPEVLRRLRRATACLHWSAWDAQALSILEAMAQDAVVVASDIPANRELLGSRQVCSTEEAASQLLRALVTDTRLRSELLAQQRARRSRYSASRMARDWLDVYQQVYSRSTAVVDRSTGA